MTLHHPFQSPKGIPLHNHNIIITAKKMNKHSRTSTIPIQIPPTVPKMHVKTDLNHYPLKMHAQYLLIVCYIF